MTTTMQERLDRKEELLGLRFGLAASRARVAKGWIHKDVAQRLGCGRRQYVRIEGGYLPDTLTFARIIEILDMDAHEALDRPRLPGPLTFAVLRSANTERCQQYRNAKGEAVDHSQWTVSDWLAAVMGELGEFANLHKKVLRGDCTHSDVRDELRDELADVAIYLDLLANKLDIDLGEAVESKFNRVSQRLALGVFLRGDTVEIRST